MTVENMATHSWCCCVMWRLIAATSIHHWRQKGQWCVSSSRINGRESNSCQCGWRRSSCTSGLCASDSVTGEAGDKTVTDGDSEGGAWDPGYRLHRIRRPDLLGKTRWGANDQRFVTRKNRALVPGNVFSKIAPFPERVLTQATGRHTVYSTGSLSPTPIMLPRDPYAITHGRSLPGRKPGLLGRRGEAAL